MLDWDYQVLCWFRVISFQMYTELYFTMLLLFQQYIQLYTVQVFLNLHDLGDTDNFIEMVDRYRYRLDAHIAIVVHWNMLDSHSS